MISSISSHNIDIEIFESNQNGSSSNNKDNNDISIISSLIGITIIMMISISSSNYCLQS